MASGKLIYLAKRNPSLTREEFVRRWRQHGAFAMQLERWSSIDRCAYCDVLPPLPGIAEASDDYDGVATIWFRDSTPASPGDRDRLRADELETFSDYVDTFRLDVREEVVRAGRGLVKATIFITDSAPQDRESFDTRWIRHADNVLHRPEADSIRAYVRNHVRIDPSRPTPQLPFTGVAEYWFDSLGALTDCLGSTSVRACFGDGVESFDPGSRNVLVATNEVVLYDRALRP